MKLQETAFMISLIRANYHRRMKYFLINLAIIIIPLVVLYYYHDKFVLSLGQALSLYACAGLAAIRLLLVYFDDDQVNLPWSIKKRQTKALNETISAEAPFEDLGNSVPLQEYFRV